MAPRIIGDRYASSIIDIEDLKAGEGIIGTSQGRIGTNVPSVVAQNIPRPSSGSTAPRPLQTKPPPTFGRQVSDEEKALSFAKMKADRGAGPVSARERAVGGVVAESQRPAREAQALAQKEREFAQKMAIEGEGERVKGEATVKVQELKNVQDTLKLGVEDKLERDKLESQRRESIRGREYSAKIDAMKAQKDIIVEQLKLAGKRTPLQDVQVNSLDSIDEQRTDLEADIVDLAEILTKTADPAARKIIEDQIGKKQGKFTGLDTRYTNTLKQLEDAENAQIGATDALVTEASDAINTATAPVADLNGDGESGDADDVKANGRINFLRGYEALQKSNPSDPKIQAQAAAYERAKIEQAEWAKGIKQPQA